MTTYTLYNKKDKKPLRHPQVGLWYTTNKMEADEMLGDLLDYLRIIGMEHMKEDFKVIDTNEIA